MTSEKKKSLLFPSFGFGWKFESNTNTSDGKSNANIQAIQACLSDGVKASKSKVSFGFKQQDQSHNKETIAER